MILITGGLGYLGTHTAASLVAEGHDVLLVDNMVGAQMEMLERLEYVTGKFITFVRQDIRNTPAMQRLFKQYGVSAVVHFAGLNANADSLRDPLEFYNANVGGLLSILRVMNRTGARTLLYGSSATVYAASPEPVSESSLLSPLTPYARGHDMCEQILHDIFENTQSAQADVQRSSPSSSDVHANTSYIDTHSGGANSWRIAMMRYGYVAGSEASHVLGELPVGEMSKLFPSMAMVAQGTQDTLPIYGDEHDTHDGTCVRDYVHVQDVVEANMQALAYLHSHDHVMDIFNIGSGQGSSVRDVVKAFSDVSGEPIDTEVVSSRPSEVAECVLDIAHAETVLKWQPKHDLAQICQDTWQFYEALSS